MDQATDSGHFPVAGLQESFMIQRACRKVESVGSATVPYAPLKRRSIAGRIPIKVCMSAGLGLAKKKLSHDGSWEAEEMMPSMLLSEAQCAGFSTVTTW